MQHAAWVIAPLILITVVGLSASTKVQLTLADLRLVFSVPIAGQLVGNVPPGTLVDHAAIAWRRLGLKDSPSALLLVADGFLAGDPVGGINEIREFVGDVRDALNEAVVSVNDVGQE